MSGSLLIAGAGITLVGQVTLETQAALAQADKVLYLLNDRVMAEWVHGLNRSAESLARFYGADKLRLQTYREMAAYVLTHVRQGQQVCLLLYGHPGVFALPAHLALRGARQEGFSARMLPGVSAEDCLFADLGIDPGVHGCVSIEATNFLIRGLEPAVSMELVVWQVGAVGVMAQAGDNRLGVQLLLERLLVFYPADHEVVLYEASKYPGLSPQIDRLPLGKLAQATVTRMATLYVPPLCRAPLDEEMLGRLGLRREALRWDGD